MIGYKELAAMDPVSDPRYVTTMWRNIQPEGELIGVQYNDFSAPTVSDMVVTNASHWLFGGTGVSNGTIFPNVVGYETDSLYPPTGATGLAHSPFPRGSPQVYADMSIYTAPSGANVFATGTIEWSLGLDGFPPSQGVVPAVQQVTANFLSRALQSTAPPPTVSSVNPNSGAQGQSLPSVILSGSNFQSGATCNFGAGITVNSCALNSATQLTANIAISSPATVGPGNVTVTNPDSQTGTLTNGFTVTTGGPPPSPPTPAGLTATAGNAQVGLAWNASTGAASYNLYHAVNGGAYSQLNTSPITTTSYTDTGLTNGTPYCYEVTAVNSSGESARSSAACATPQPLPFL
jgi:hypothetical protein